MRTFIFIVRGFAPDTPKDPRLAALRSAILGCAAAALIACGGRTDEKHGLVGPSSGEPEADYPAGEYGYGVGEVVPNVAFLGYAHLDPTTTIDAKVDAIAAVHFSDFYDPTGERGLSYLYVSVQYVWCGPSNEQDDFTNGANYTGMNTGGASFAKQFAAKGVRFMTLLGDGPVVGTDATVSDLMSWVTNHHARVSEALLEQDELVLNVVGPNAPYNMIVDLRTMRVVDVEIGFDTQFSALAKLVTKSRVLGGQR